MAKTEPGASNVFNFSQPERYRCQVHHYHRKLSRLYLSVYAGARPQPALYLLFTDLAYLQAPMSWVGAQFDIAMPESCIALMLEAGLLGAAFRDFPAAYHSVTAYTRLYQARALPESAVQAVQIIASSASILQRIPPELEWG